MKNLIVFILTLYGGIAHAQLYEIEQGSAIDIEEETFDCGYTQEQADADWIALQPAIKKYSTRNARTPAVPPVLSWPLQPSCEVYSPGYYVMSNQVDLDPGSGVLDYSGRTRTYNGHGGIDIRLWPYYWTMMDEDLVEVIASADGIIVNKVDGNFDRRCSCAGSSNRIDILHPGGYSTYYLHLKSGSLTSKGIGDPVSKGEFLGTVGSSGCSSNPHLHFHVVDENGSNVEPYAGPSNPSVPNSLWDVQKPYYESSIVRLMTHSGPTSLNNCPTSTDTPNEQNHFNPGSTVRFGSYYMSPQVGQSASYSVRDPNGVLRYSWSRSFNTNFARSANYFDLATLPTSAALGTWELRVNFTGNGQVAYHHFTVGCTSNISITGNHGDGDGYIASNQITSTATLSAGDDDVHYEAGNRIIFNPGFEAISGCSFRTRLDDCSVGGQ